MNIHSEWPKRKASQLDLLLIKRKLENMMFLLEISLCLALNI